MRRGFNYRYEQDVAFYQSKKSIDDLRFQVTVANTPVINIQNIELLTPEALGWLKKNAMAIDANNGLLLSVLELSSTNGDPDLEGLVELLKSIASDYRNEFVFVNP